MVKLYPVQFSHFCYIGHPKFNIFDKGCSMKIIAIKKKSIVRQRQWGQVSNVSFFCRFL